MEFEKIEFNGKEMDILRNDESVYIQKDGSNVFSGESYRTIEGFVTVEGETYLVAKQSENDEWALYNEADVKFLEDPEERNIVIDGKVHQIGEYVHDSKDRNIGDKVLYFEGNELGLFKEE